MTLQKGRAVKDACIQSPGERAPTGVPKTPSPETTVLAVVPSSDGLRKHGSYKRYMARRIDDVLACRGLAQRGKLATEHRALNFLAKQGDNGIVWTVLSWARDDD